MIFLIKLLKLAKLSIPDFPSIAEVTNKWNICNTHLVQVKALQLDGCEEPHLVDNKTSE